jgi:hypothetical protein
MMDLIMLKKLMYAIAMGSSLTVTPAADMVFIFLKLIN